MSKGILCVILPVLERIATLRRVRRRTDLAGCCHLAAASLVLFSLLVSPPSLLATEFLYDNLNRLERAIYPDGRAIAYSYDNTGNRHSREVVMVSVTPSPSGPSDVGTTVTVRASVLGGSGAPHEFQFWRKRGVSGPYLLVRDFGTADNVVWNTDPWTNTLAETYRWRIYARHPGSPLAYESFGEAPYTLTVPPGGYYTSQGWGNSADNVVIGDFDGDGKADVAVWRSSEGQWWILRSSDNVVTSIFWGSPTDNFVPGDYDGDGKTDVAVWRPSTGQWWIRRSSDNVVTSIFWGSPTDNFVPGDYDGDGKTDVAVWWPSTGQWWIKRSSDNAEVSIPWGSPTDMPVQGDYDGDGKTDVAVWRPSTGQWWIQRSSDGVTVVTDLGSSNDRPVPGDYDGDGNADVAVWRPSTGGWLIRRSSDNTVVTTYWGSPTDIPVQGDYDGDGKTDLAVWRPSTGVWWMRFF